MRRHLADRGQAPAWLKRTQAGRAAQPKTTFVSYSFSELDVEEADTASAAFLSPQTPIGAQPRFRNDCLCGSTWSLELEMELVQKSRELQLEPPAPLPAPLAPFLAPCSHF